MNEIKSRLSNKERWVFALMLGGFFLVLAWLCWSAPGGLISAAAFTGACALVSLLLNRAERALRQLPGLAVPAVLLVTGLAGGEGGVVRLFAVVMLVGAGVTGGVASLASARAGLAAYRAWMLGALPIGWTISRVVMGAAYYGVITPIGVIMRLLGRDALSLRFDRSAESYWVVRRRGTDAGRYLRQW